MNDQEQSFKAGYKATQKNHAQVINIWSSKRMELAA